MLVVARLNFSWAGKFRANEKKGTNILNETLEI